MDDLKWVDENLITPFRNREIEVNKEITLTRCRSRKGKVYSVKQFGKVVGHTSQLTLVNVTLIVTSTGKAYVKGKITYGVANNAHLRKVTYDYGVDETYICHGTSDLFEITTSELVIFNKNGIFAVPQ